MIFGKSSEEKEAIRREKAIKKILGVRQFALFPRQLETGRWIWLEFYWAYYKGILSGSKIYIGSFESRKYLFKDSNHIIASEEVLKNIGYK